MDSLFLMYCIGLYLTLFFALVTGPTTEISFGQILAVSLLWPIGLPMVLFLIARALLRVE